MRQIYEYAKMAYRNIMGSKMRSFLTMLGIIIGIGAVIMVLCIGGGGQRMMDSELGMLSSGSVYLSVTGEGYHCERIILPTGTWRPWAVWKALRA